MKKFSFYPLLLALVILINFSCRKTLTETPSKGDFATKAAGIALAQSYCYSCGIVDNMPATDHSSDTTDLPTILGMQHVNPYLVPNMQRAYANLGDYRSLCNCDKLLCKIFTEFRATIECIGLNNEYSGIRPV